jgi:hypothetical protein
LNLGSGGVECLTLPATAPKAGSEVSIVATTHGCRFGAKDFGPIDLSYAVPICNDICRVKTAYILLNAHLVPVVLQEESSELWPLLKRCSF